MIDLRADAIAAAMGATIVGGPCDARDEHDFPSRGSVDSRTTCGGDLFFGLRGNSADGGAFASQAIESGAWGIVVRPHYARGLPRGRATGVRVFSVADPQRALTGLARAWLGRLRAGGCRVVGITGSSGKTSTKDILVSLLRAALAGRAAGSRENFNTEIGLPLSILETERGTRALALEMAMRGLGQIRELAGIARPDVGVITNIGPVHLELVGTIEKVAAAKAELIAELPSGSACVVPALEEALHPHLRSDVRVITFAPMHGSKEESSPIEDTAGAAADVRALSVVREDAGLRAEVAIGAERGWLRFNFTELHNLSNALAALGATHALGLELAGVAAGASQVRFSRLRGQRLELDRGVLVIDDSYNANPSSMRAALDHLAAEARRRESRAVAVVGDMKELGDHAARYHRETGRHAARVGVTALVAVGEHGDDYAAGYGSAGEFRAAKDAEEGALIASELIEPQDTVLIKASRSVGLEVVAERLGETYASTGAG